MVVNFNQISGFKELIVSYKVIYINTYNIMVLDISHQCDHRIIYRHESS